MTRTLNILGLLCLLLLGVIGGAGAQTPVFEDTFTRANTAAGGVANGWVDSAAVWEIISNAAGNSNQTSGALLLRPTAENLTEVQVNATVTTISITGAGATSPAVYVRYQSSSNFYSAFAYSGNLWIGNGHTNTSFGSIVGYANNASYIITVSAHSTDTTHTNVVATIANAATPATILVSATLSGDTAGPQTAGQEGIGGYQVPSCSFTDFKEYNTPINQATAVSLPAISFVSASSTSIVLTNTAATGGTAPYSYQWYRSDNNSGSPSAISGATTLTLTDTPPNSDVWFYTLKATDSASANTTTPALPELLIGAPYAVGFIGDSITGRTDTAANAAPFYFKSIVNHVYPLHQVSIVNSGVGGSTTATWLPTDTTSESTASTLSTNNYYRATAAFAAGGVKYVMLMLGTNDANSSVSPATYGANLNTICTGLTALNYTVILNYPPCQSTGTAGTNSTQAYEPNIDALCNGSTILQGDRACFIYFATHLTEFADLFHPNDAGIQSYAKLWSNAFIRSVATPVKSVVFTGQIKRGR